MPNKHNSNHTKRFGHHHKKTKKYHSTYWPFIPVLLLIISVFAWSIVRSPVSVGVLAFATEMSAESLLLETNRQRHANGVASLSMNDQLRAAAQAKAEDMARDNYWAHVAPDGTEPWSFIDATDYQYAKAGENLAYGFLTSTQTVKGWMNSSTHRDNMLDNEFRQVGFGFVHATGFQSNAEETIVVALYARPLSAEQQTAVSASSQSAISMTVPETAPAQETLAVSRLATLTGNQFPWAVFALGIFSGGAAIGMIATHARRLQSLLHKGEEFVLHHPMLDFCLLSILVVTAFLASHVGYIA
jgi:uncharacterized protein YkwD